MCEIIDLDVFHPNIAISVPNTNPTAILSVPIGAIGENILKYPPIVFAAVVTSDGKPVEFGKSEIIPFMTPYPRFIRAVVIIWVCVYREFE